jgi:hypothetical protein
MVPLFVLRQAQHERLQETITAFLLSGANVESKAEQQYVLQRQGAA